MKEDKIISEKSCHHWMHLETAEKNILDLGCGRHWTTEKEDFSPFFLGKKANKVVGVDMSQTEIDYYNAINDDKDKYIFICSKIDSPEFLKDLIINHSINCIKCDIEGYEKVFYEFTKEEMDGRKNLAIEYHSSDIYENIKNLLISWGFNIDVRAKFEYDHRYAYVGSVDIDKNHMGVLFCSKK